MLQDIQEVLLMLKRIKQYFCPHNHIETRSETGLIAVDNGYFFVKTLIRCTKCKKSFDRHPKEMCCYVMHIQYELIRKCIIDKINNDIKVAKQ